jgi:hypothetical protein
MYHANRAGGGVPLALMLSLCMPALEAVAGEDTAAPAGNTTIFDRPDDAELLRAYQSDHSNQKVQSWGQYKGWVQTFYQGNLLSEGWSKFARVTVSGVKSAANRQAIIAQITDLGRIIGLEWAKDSSVQKITTSDLKRWNAVMASARQGDDGSGQQIINALKVVRTMAANRR